MGLFATDKDFIGRPQGREEEWCFLLRKHRSQ
jgi:hypothetical protein